MAAHDHGPNYHVRHHHNHHAPATHEWAFAIGVGLNSAFIAAEITFGVMANSVALLADAMHNIGDVLALLLAWAASWLARRPPTVARTYGWGRFSILAALANAILLLLGVGAIAWEALGRLSNPSAVDAHVVIWVAAVGIAVNGATALLFLRGQAEDLNIRTAFWHMAADALVSAGVVAAAVLIGLTGLLWLDPLASLLIALVIAAGTWGLLRQSMGLALDAVPAGIDPAALTDCLRALPGVTEVHDLHVWGLSTTDIGLTAHLVTDALADGGLLGRAIHAMEEKFHIHHATFQLESAADAARCRLRPASVI